MRNIAPADALLDVNEEDRVVNNIRIAVEEKLPGYKPYNDDAMSILQKTKEQIVVTQQNFTISYSSHLHSDT